MKLLPPPVRWVPPADPIPNCASADKIGPQITALRGHLVLLNTNLAAIFGVTTSRLEEALRPHEPLPGDFWFLLDSAEVLLFSAGGLDPRGTRPRLAFTEHGSLLAAAFLGTPTAFEIGVVVMRAFVRRRQERRVLGWTLGTNSEARKP